MSIFSISMIRCYFITCLGVMAFTASAVAGSETSRETSTSESLRRFTLRQAIETAFQRNPDILRARQEIRRTKGVQIQVVSQALPHLDATAAFNYTDPSLRSGSSSGITSGSPVPTVTPVPTMTPIARAATMAPITRAATIGGNSDSFTIVSDTYDLRLTGSQLIYNGSVIPAIKGAGAAKGTAFRAASGRFQDDVLFQRSAPFARS